MSLVGRPKIMGSRSKCKALFFCIRLVKSSLWVFVVGESIDPTPPGEGCSWLTFWACKTVCAQLTFLKHISKLSNYILWRVILSYYPQSHTPWYHSTVNYFFASLVFTNSDIALVDTDHAYSFLVIIRKLEPFYSLCLHPKIL